MGNKITTGLCERTTKLIDKMSYEEVDVLLNKWCRRDMQFAAIKKFGFQPNRKTIEALIGDKLIRDEILS